MRLICERLSYEMQSQVSRKARQIARAWQVCSVTGSVINLFQKMSAQGKELDLFCFRGLKRKPGQRLE